jgi:hypothetical protein
VTECDRIREEAPGLAALPASDPGRAAASSHAQGCPACARALREAEGLQALLSEWEPPPLPAGALERASLAIGAELRREARRRALASAAAVCASFVAIAALARARSQSPLDRALAAALWAGAVVLALAARRWSLLAAAAALAAALAAAALAGHAGPLSAYTGVECLATELASAAAVVGAAWLALRGGTTSPSRVAMAAAAAAGALAGDAALQLACPARAAMPHLLAFHVGGLVLAAAAVSLAWRRPPAVGVGPA